MFWSHILCSQKETRSLPWLSITWKRMNCCFNFRTFSSSPFILLGGILIITGLAEYVLVHIWWQNVKELWQMLYVSLLYSVINTAGGTYKTNFILSCILLLSHTFFHYFLIFSHLQNLCFFRWKRNWNWHIVSIFGML